MIKRLIATTLLLLPVWSAIAQTIPTELECTVVAEYDLKSDGTLKTIESANKDDRFMVSRRTGIIMGKRFSNDRDKITILDAGSSEQGFKMVSVNPYGYAQPTYLQVNVFGSAPKKEFIMVWIHSRLVSGFCQ